MTTNSEHDNQNRKTEKGSESEVMNNSLFDDYDNNYNEVVNKSVSFVGLNVDFFTRVKSDYIVDVCNSHFADTSTVNALDVGCGIGNLHSLLTPHFGEINGVDVSKLSLERASQLNPNVEYHHYDGLQLPFENDTFELIYTICVLHHVPPDRWQNYVNEMYRVLKVGGLALIFEHNPRNILTLRAVNRCPFDSDAVLLPSGTCAELLESAGFNDVRKRYIFSIPAASRGLRIIDGWLSKLALGAQYYISATKK